MFTLMLNNVWMCHYADAHMGEIQSRHGMMFLFFGFTKAPNKMTLMSHRVLDTYHFMTYRECMSCSGWAGWANHGPCCVRGVCTCCSLVAKRTCEVGVICDSFA